MNRVFQLIIIVPITCLLSCLDETQSKEKAKVWKLEAKKKHDTFLLVLDEYYVNKENFLRFHNSHKQFTFLQKKHIEAITRNSKSMLPLHYEWLKSTELNYIIYYDNDDVMVKYESFNGDSSYYPLYYESFLIKTKKTINSYFVNSVSTIYDQLYLGDHWYFIVTRCNGCGM